MGMIIGVDVGNNDTKTRNTSTVSGYTAYDNEQLLAEKVLAYGGKYYIENIDERFPYVEDKTDNEQALILTLFGIAKEIIYRIRNDKNIAGNLQAEINNIQHINLAIGLPPGHFNKLARKTIDFYMAVMSKGITFTYAGYKFSFKVDAVRAYAQGLTAVLTKPGLSITDKESGIRKYYIVDIGGYTADVLTMVFDENEKNWKPENNCRSLPLGTRPMHEMIISRLQASAGITLDERSIEDVLRDKKIFLKDEVKNEVKSNAKLFAEQLIDRCIQAGCSFDRFPIVFVGGGSLLLKEHLSENKKICFSEFIDDVRSNASSYEDCMGLEPGLRK